MPSSVEAVSPPPPKPSLSDNDDSEEGFEYEEIEVEEEVEFEEEEEEMEEEVDGDDEEEVEEEVEEEPEEEPEEDEEPEIGEDLTPVREENQDPFSTVGLGLVILNLPYVKALDLGADLDHGCWLILNDKISAEVFLFGRMYLWSQPLHSRIQTLTLVLFL